MMTKLHASLTAVLLGITSLAFGQTATGYPTQPIRFVVPWPPGGGVDTTARILSEPLSQRLGQPLVIDNRAGAAGNIGTALAGHAKADGYTLLMGSISPNAVNLYLYSHLGFDPIKDFAPIIYVSSVPNILVVPAASAFKTVNDVVEYAKAHPGKLSYASGGVGSSQHLAAVQFMQVAKLDLLHVPYKGTSPAEADLVSGNVSLMLDTTTCLPFIASGKVRALAVASRKRNPALPNVPTFDEVGLPGIYASSWYGLMAPAGTPRAIIDKLNAEANAVLKTPAFEKRMLEFGAEIGGGSPEDFGNFIASEIKRYDAIVKSSGARME